MTFNSDVGLLYKDLNQMTDIFLWT